MISLINKDTALYPACCGADLQNSSSAWFLSLFTTICYQSSIFFPHSVCVHIYTYIHIYSHTIVLHWIDFSLISLGTFTPVLHKVVGLFHINWHVRGWCQFVKIKHSCCRFKSAIQQHAVKDGVLKSWMLVNPQCGGSCSWNIYTARDGGLLESAAWWLEPHSKETDKGPEDSCSAALSLT